jgi:hypothetical protein
MRRSLPQLHGRRRKHACKANGDKPRWRVRLSAAERVKLWRLGELSYNRSPQIVVILSGVAALSGSDRFMVRVATKSKNLSLSFTWAGEIRRKAGPMRILPSPIKRICRGLISSGARLAAEECAAGAIGACTRVCISSWFSSTPSCKPLFLFCAGDYNGAFDAAFLPFVPLKARNTACS